LGSEPRSPKEIRRDNTSRYLALRSTHLLTTRPQTLRSQTPLHLKRSNWRRTHSKNKERRSNSSPSPHQPEISLNRHGHAAKRPEHAIVCRAYSVLAGGRRLDTVAPFMLDAAVGLIWLETGTWRRRRK
jgi:hypothetical protein